MAANAFPPQLIMMPMLASFLALSVLSLSVLSLSQPGIPAVKLESTEEWCPPCDFFFRRLKRTEGHAKLTQIVRVQERGEPKSGTGIMFDWSTGALVATCNYLQQFYGENSCRVEGSPGYENDEHLKDRRIDRQMVFEPARGIGDARCPCETIERVSIATSQRGKHLLPVNGNTCAFRHYGGIELARTERNGDHQKEPCKFADGTRPTNNDELWRCMYEADCDITDDWLQMVIFRDPRPAVVSTYYYLKVHQIITDLGDLESFVLRELPILCQWLAVRHILFTGLLAHQSMEFWYDESMADPSEWYYHWFDSVGLQLPYDVVSDVAKAAGANNLDFYGKKIDKHPGERINDYSGVRKFENEVSPDILKSVNAVLRTWLPAVLLEKLGIPPEEEEA